MIIHLVHDEKIINRVIRLFDLALPKQNVFVLCSHRKTFKFISESSVCLFYKDFISKYTIKPEDKVIIHNLNIRKINFIEQFVPRESKVYWIIWGADLYNRMLAPKGYCLYSKGNPYVKHSFFDKLIAPINIRKDKENEKRIAKFVMNRVQVVMTDTTDNDYDELLAYYPSMSHKAHLPFFYYPIDEVLNDQLLGKTVKGKDIQIGNSCSPTNNHTYAMEILSKLDLGDRKVVVPLSYSVRKKYRNKVIEAGRDLLKENFSPLLNFMPLDEYNNLLSSIQIAIYANFRQEAIGNILVSLYLGAKVFLSRQNPIHEWARRNELKTFILEEISQKDIEEPLEGEQQEKHKLILSNLYSKEKLNCLILDYFSDN